MIILGSAQFGSEYAGSKKKYLTEDLSDILKLANENNVTEIDTAMDYGSAELNLGRADCSKFKINTKLPKNISLGISSAEDLINKSLDRLKHQRLNILFIHSVKNFLNASNAEKIYDDILACIEKKLVSKIGISVYSTEEILAFRQKFECDVVQGPFNYFDDRLLQFSKQNGSCNFDVQYRSIFLQGTLLRKSLRAGLPFQKQFKEFDQAVRGSEYSSNLEFCLKYFRSAIKDGNPVIGVTSLQELSQIFDILRAENDFPIKRNIFSKNNFYLVSPYSWVRS